MSSEETVVRNVTVVLERDEQLAQLELATLVLIFVVATVGNACVLLALSVRRAKLSRMFFYILHLSVADLVTAFFNVLPQLAWEITYRFKGGDMLCRAVKFGQLLGPYLSSFVLVVTAVDRYHAVCSPLAYCTWSARRARLLVTAAWAVALLCCVPQAFIFSYRPLAPGVYDCWAVFPAYWGERAYVSWYAVSVFLAPLLVLVFTYTGICRAIWRNYNAKKRAADGTDLVQTTTTSKEVSQLQLPRAHSVRGISRAKMKTVKLTVVVIACYVVCSSPFICAQLWATWDPSAMHSPFWSGPTFTILTLLASLNSCVNPWIYLVFNPDLAQLLTKALTCRSLPKRGRPGPGGGSNSSADSRSGGSQRGSSRGSRGSGNRLTTRPLLFAGPGTKCTAGSSAKILNFHLLRTVTAPVSTVIVLAEPT